MKMSVRSAGHRGFTLVELLVVISIIGVLVGLLLPAIQAARAAGRRTQCQNNIRNVAMGILAYANLYGKFPPAGVITDDPNKQNPGNPPIQVPRNQGIVSWHDPKCTPDSIEVPMYNWVVEILPFIDQQDLFNSWSKVGPASRSGGGTETVPYSYLNTNNVLAGRASNYEISSKSLAVLRCPDDTTITPGAGNLSYVVNGGFSLWTALPIGWTGSSTDGQPTANAYDDSGARWASPTQGWGGNLNVCRKLGVMFLEDYGNFGPAASQMPWNARTTFASIYDGASNTLLVSENTLAGAGPPSSYSKTTETNWASPLANFCMFFGSPSVCGADGQCISGGLQPQPGGVDGPGWAMANRVGTFTEINFGQHLTTKGSFPFSNSGHAGGCNMAFCDGPCGSSRPPSTVPSTPS
jgi:prepilin-type N-terminal cleavage/methylation domain-containing protein/prepilin-type processing-associated H-X9-DG protein